MRYLNILKIDEMSLEEKILELFKIFPRQNQYYDDLLQSIRIPRGKGLSISSFHQGIYWLEIYLEGFGTFKKHWEIDTDGYKGVYSVSFSPGESTKSANELGPLELDKCNKICEKVISFMSSYGKDKKLIPLLVNDYPAFAKFALEFVYDPEY